MLIFEVLQEVPVRFFSLENPQAARDEANELRRACTGR